jgi:hypothetical protein
MFEKFGDLCNGSFGKRLLGSKYWGGGFFEIERTNYPKLCKKSGALQKISARPPLDGQKFEELE